MGDVSAIEWTGATWNPWQGCRRKSEGCRFCYMFRDMARYGADPKHIRRSTDGTFRRPLRWQKEVEAGKRTGQGRLVFTCSWSDWFIKEADAWRDDAWEIIRRCPGLIFQILTKRADRMADHLPPCWPEIRDRCWLGVSAEDQRNYDLRRPYVDADLSPVMWWSMEPLLGPIAAGFDDYAHKPGWCVVGGESGLASEPIRPMHIGWARSLRDQCSEANVPFLFKQWGEWSPGNDSGCQGDRLKVVYRDGEAVPCSGDAYLDVSMPMRLRPNPDRGGYLTSRVGKKSAGRLLDGIEHDGYPAVLEVARA